MFDQLRSSFTITVEVVTPAGPDPAGLLDSLGSIGSLQGLLWGARALDINTVPVATGDAVALGERLSTTIVRDVDVFGFVEMARESGLVTGVVMTYHQGRSERKREVRRLERKIERGAQFVVTQPIYDEASVQALA